MRQMRPPHFAEGQHRSQHDSFMAALLDTINAWADHALRFAWPMLWQSSLLIGVLFALDLLLRRRLRPAVRYALWLVVLVKVLLPPSLAFPTGPGWWLRPAQVVPAKPHPTSVVVTYSTTEDPPAMPSVATPVVLAPARPRLTPVAQTFTGMVAVSLDVRILDFSRVVVLNDLTRRIRRGQNEVKPSSIEGG
jgi:hypothetical protein